MAPALVLGIGPVALALQSESPAVIAHLQARYGRYLTDDEAAARLTIATGHAYDPLTAWTLHWQEDEAAWRAEAGAVTLHFDARRRQGEAQITADPDGLPSAVDNVVRGLGARLLAADGCLLIHGCGIVEAEGLHVFYGPSGVGKTTLARLAAAAGQPVAGDDLIVIDPDRRLGCGSPFWGEGGDLPATQGWWPLAGCWQLQQAAQADRTPLTGAQAVAELLCQAPLPQRYVPWLLEQVTRLCAHVPQHRLALPLPKSWQAVREVAFDG